MGPLIPNGFIPGDWSFVIALLLGIAFGFILEASGFSSSRNIVGVFYGYNFVVLRVFFTAVIVAMVGLIYFDYFGWLDLSKIYILPTYLAPMIAGGVIMGLGFIFGGFCPGTSFTAIAIGKIDGLVFTIGLYLGIFAFSLAFPLFEEFYNSGEHGKCYFNGRHRIVFPVVCLWFCSGSTYRLLGDYVDRKACQKKYYRI